MNNIFASIRKFFGRKKFRYGGYAVLISLVGIAVIVLLNVGLTTLENNYDLKIDTTQNKKYSIGTTTQKILEGLTKDIKIYTTYPAGSESKDITEILNKIKALSPHISIENKDTEKDPTFMSKFTKQGQSISNGSIIVSDADGKLFRVLDQYAQYDFTTDQSTGQTYPTQIKVEGSIANAINYIQLGYMPTAFVVQGHGELKISDMAQLNAYMSDDNYNVEAVNIAQTPDKLKPGDIVMFFNPSSDISDAERDKLMTLLDKGGRFYFLFDPVVKSAKDMPNIQSLLKQFDIELKNGIVIESNPSNMITPNYPTVLVPNIANHAITSPFSSSNIPLVIPVSGAIKLPETPPETSMTITPLLTSSDKSYIKDINAQDTTQTPQDETGPFDIAVAVEKKVGSSSADTVKMVVVYNTAFATNSDLTSRYQSNILMFMSGASWLRNADKEIKVNPKLITAPMFNISNAVQFWIIIVVSVLLIPLLMLVAGIVIYLRRKHL